jgi:putative methyltransferase (TIGR04325 family)
MTSTPRALIRTFYNRFADFVVRLGSDRPIWEGVYKYLSEIKIENNDWEYYTKWQCKEAERLLDKEHPDEYFVGDRALFPLMVSLLNKPSLKIYDIGGGAGFDFLALLNCCYKFKTTLDYRIIDLIAITTMQPLFVKYPEAKFHATIPKNEKPDIVLLNSSLQYFDDYHKELEDIAKLGAEYIMFIRLSAVTSESYVSKQINIPDTQTPYWFVNIYEVIIQMKSLGYDLVYQSRGDCTYYQGNFKPEYRMGRTWNLLFRKGLVIE